MFRCCVLAMLDPPLYYFFGGSWGSLGPPLASARRGTIHCKYAGIGAGPNLFGAMPPWADDPKKSLTTSFGQCTPGGCSLVALFSHFSAPFPLLSLPLISQIALRTCPFDLCIRPSTSPPTASTLCGSLPGPAECAKRLNNPLSLIHI